MLFKVLTCLKPISKQTILVLLEVTTQLNWKLLVASRTGKSIPLFLVGNTLDSKHKRCVFTACAMKGSHQLRDKVGMLF